VESADKIILEILKKLLAQLDNIHRIELNALIKKLEIKIREDAKRGKK